MWVAAIITQTGERNQKPYKSLSEHVVQLQIYRYVQMPTISSSQKLTMNFYYSSTEVTNNLRIKASVLKKTFFLLGA